MPTRVMPRGERERRRARAAAPSPDERAHATAQAGPAGWVSPVRYDSYTKFYESLPE